MSFIVEGRSNGINRRITIGRYPDMEPDMARIEARRLLDDLSTGINPIRWRDRLMGPTLEKRLNDYLANSTLKARTKLTYRQAMNRSLGDWLSLPITAITKEMVIQRHRELVRPTRCGTDNKPCANRAMEILRVLINYARVMYLVDGKSIITENPVKALRWRWYSKEVREGIIPDNRLADFYRELWNVPKIARDFFLILLLTALRRNEVARLRWADIDLDNRTITIDAECNKSNRIHTLPLSPMVVAILESRRNDSTYVFPGRNRGHLNEPRAQIAYLRKALGWNWLIHDLRRTALSAAEKSGAPYLAIQKIANHVAHRDVTDRYLVLDIEYIRPFMQAMNDRLLSLMGTTVQEWQALDTKPTVRIESVAITEQKEVEHEELYW
jgi:integrase